MELATATRFFWSFWTIIQSLFLHCYPFQTFSFFWTGCLYNLHFKPLSSLLIGDPIRYCISPSVVSTLASSLMPLFPGHGPSPGPPQLFSCRDTLPSQPTFPSSCHHVLAVWLLFFQFFWIPTKPAFHNSKSLVSFPLQSHYSPF